MLEPHGPVSWNHPPLLTWPPSFEVTQQPYPLLWGTGLGKADRARGMPRKGIYVWWLPARLSLASLWLPGWAAAS